MRERAFQTGFLILALVAFAGSARAAEGLWLHVTVDEGQSTKVTVNLPLALAEKALPMLPWPEDFNWSNHDGRRSTNLEDFRKLWSEVKNSPDMTFVTVQEEDEAVKVWKAEDFVFVEVRAENGSEKVDVKIPMRVMDALVGGKEIDFEGAIQALAESGGGDLVSVRDRNDNVRVWIDKTPEARPAFAEETR